MMAQKESITAAEFTAKWEQEIPMRRLGEPREFAALAAFLVSERAAYMIFAAFFISRQLNSLRTLGVLCVSAVW